MRRTPGAWDTNEGGPQERTPELAAVVREVE
jgi:hypothetical protein